MTKKEREQQTPAEQPAAEPAAFRPQDLVRVRVKRAVGHDGIALRPRVDGERTFPTIGILPYAVARSYGPAYVEIIERAPAGSRVGQV